MQHPPTESLCRFHGDSSKCEMQVPPGLSVEGPPWNSAEWIGRIVARNCAFTSFPNGLWLSVGPTFTNEHLFLLIAPLVHVLCIQNRHSWVLCRSCKIFHDEPFKNTTSVLPLQLVLQKSKEVTLIFATGTSTHKCCLHLGFRCLWEKYLKINLMWTYKHDLTQYYTQQNPLNAATI